VGAPPPIALTLRFPSDASATEDEWQELVVEHLGVEQRVLEVRNELELVGPVARAELFRRGVLFPPNAHLIAPLLPHAARGSLLVGLGGDEFLGDHRWEQLNDLLARRRRPRWRDARRAAVAALPGALRGPVLGYRDRVERPWLLPSASRRIQALEARSADEPVRFDRAVARLIRRSYFQLCLASLRRVGDLAGVSVEAPLADPRFVAALALAGGARGWGSRSATMRTVADGALPERLVARRGKAVFDTAFFGEASRRFAEEWSGGGVDTSLVDPEELRRAWLGLVQPFRTATLLQLAWLHDHSEEARSASAGDRPSAAVA
jgi:asparagine synthase (glutamine-hydrolysing)